MHRISRRKFLTLSTGTAGALLLTRCASNPTVTPLTSRTGAIQAVSTNGLLEVALEACAGNIPVAEHQGNLLSYNGQIPGPRLEARPGDTVRIHFANRLTDPTNLHYHGLHIPPTGNADNIFLSVPSGETLTYEFTLPKKHPSGTFYYHPHLHERVAEQVFGGLGGIFVVRGALDEIPEVRAAREEFLFLKDFALVEGRVPAPGHMELMQGREGAIVTVNGRVNPSLNIATGELLRLRFVNASTSRFYRLALEEHPFYLIATDGGAISEPIELRELILSPGERAEVLVKGDRSSGQFRLFNLPYDRGGSMGMMGGGMGGMMHSSSPQNSTPQTMATLAYKGSVKTQVSLPKKLIAVETLPKPSRTRRIELSMAMGGGMGMAFLFNGKPFDPDRVDATVKLGSVEDWELVNLDPDGMVHSFHLHTNAFQVISRNGQPASYRAWEDTIQVGQNETLRIRIPFRDFTGKTVYHCHVLDHEDLGMMGIVEVQA
jgi:FtsP/CotA-like multicopper oxidase with cupredoxin domain